MLRSFLYLLLLSSMAIAPGRTAPGDSSDLKARAYEAFRQNKFAEATNAFHLYLEQNSQDIAATLDYAAALAQLNQEAEAARLLEKLHQQHPANEAAYFRLGQMYVQLKRYAEAEKVFQELERSANMDMAAAAPVPSAA